MIGAEPLHIEARLEIFEGQAVYRVNPTVGVVPNMRLLRLRRGSRTVDLVGGRP